jgi:hypothetical protein
MQFVVYGPLFNWFYSNGVLAMLELAASIQKIGLEVTCVLSQSYPHEEIALSVSSYLDIAAKNPIRHQAFVGALKERGLKIADPVATLGDDVIVIYPETVNGNPLGAKNIVRYFGNKPGVLKPAQCGAGREFILAHTDGLVSESDAVCFFARQNPCFNDIGTLPVNCRPIDITYVGKGGLYCSPFIVEGSIEVTRAWPFHKTQLANLLRACRFFYTFDSWSNTNIEALLCGAVPVFLERGPFIDAEIDGTPYGKIPRMTTQLTSISDEEARVFELERRAFVARVDATATGWDDSVNLFVQKAFGFFN